MHVLAKMANSLWFEDLQEDPVLEMITQTHKAQSYRQRRVLMFQTGSFHTL